LSIIRVAAVQAAPLPVTGLPVFGSNETLGAFAIDVERVRSQVDGPVLVVYPEFHLFGTDGNSTHDASNMMRAAAEPLESELVRALADIAREAQVWLIPGSVCELGSAREVYNTALVLSPDGVLAGSYRKLFPWRPYEWSTPGNRLVTVDLPDIGRLGLSICYDAWFPEVSRHLAWMGADVIVNVAKTTTPDRTQEIVLARANAIVNQVFTVNVNTAGPHGRGRSIITDPEGAVLEESTDASTCVLFHEINLERVAEVRRVGTAGTNRMWEQFQPNDAPVEMPLYSGRIEPHRWAPLASAVHQPQSSGDN